MSLSSAPENVKKVNITATTLADRVPSVRRKPKLRKRGESKIKEEERQRELKRKTEREAFERNQREKILTDIKVTFDRVKSKFLQAKHRTRYQGEWERYLECNARVPFIEQPPQSRANFQLWCNTTKYAYIDEIFSEIEFFLPIFGIMRQIADEPLKINRRIAADIREVLENWRNEMINKIDYACYLLIRGIETNFNKIDFYTSNYFLDHNLIKLSMWSLLKHPMKQTQKRDTPLVSFPNSNVTVGLPVPYDFRSCVLRVLFTKFDFISDKCKTRFPPPCRIPKDLLSEVQRCHKLLDKIAQEISEAEKEVRNERKSKSDGQLSRGGKLRMSEVLSSSSKMIGDEYDTMSVSSKASVQTARTRTSSVYSAMEMLEKRSFASIVAKAKVRDSIYSKASRPKRHGSSGVKSMRSSHEMSAIRKDLLDHFGSMDSKSSLQESPTSSQECKRSIASKFSYYTIDERLSASYSELLSHILIKGDSREQSIRTLRDLMKSSSERQDEEKTSAMGTQSEMFNKRDEDLYNEFVKSVSFEVEPNEMNLRKYSIFSGIYFIDILQHNSDTCHLKCGDILCIQDGPYQLYRDDYFYNYIPKMETAEQNELLSQDITEMDLMNFLHLTKDENLKKLISVEIQLRSDVFWFVTPKPVMWDEKKHFWSDQFIHDISYNKEKKVIFFRLCKPGIIALAAPRYLELPFSKWELTPNPKGKFILLHLEGKTLDIIFKVSGSKVCLHKLEGTSQTILNDIIDNEMELNNLIEIMKSAGLDVFPDYDSFLYVEGCRCKPFALEDHIYMTMALVCKLLEFKSSVWNLVAGARDIIFQCRKFQASNPFSYQTLKANLFRTEILLIDDLSSVFLSGLTKDMDFQPDTFSLLLKLYSNILTFSNSDLPLVSTVYHLLMRTKVLTFSGSQSKLNQI